MTVQLPNLHGQAAVSHSDRRHSASGAGVGAGEEGEEEEESSHALEQVFACVADGVGSWRARGVDPRLYSHRLVENTQYVIRAESSRRMDDHVLYKASHLGDKGKSNFSFSTGSRGGGGGRGGARSSREELQSDEAVHPLDALYEAWYMTNKDQEVNALRVCCGDSSFLLMPRLITKIS